MAGLSELNTLGKSSVFDENIKKLIYNSHGMHLEQKDVQKFDKFSQYGYFDIPNINSFYREYIFFTKPDLTPLGGEDAGYHSFISTYHPKVLEYLTKGGNGFIPLLTNSVVINNGVDVPDATQLDFESMTNSYGASVSYKGHSLEGRYNTEFTVEFNDTRFLDVYMLFHYWDRYSNAKMLGYVMPKATYLPPKNVLEDQISVYKIIVGDDYSTIVYFGKWTGVYPRSLPRNVFQTLEGGLIKMSVSFKAFDYEDMTPEIINEFNIAAGSSSGVKSGNSKYVGVGTSANHNWRSKPFIKTGKINNRPVYKLIWGD